MLWWISFALHKSHSKYLKGLENMLFYSTLKVTRSKCDLNLLRSRPITFQHGNFFLALNLRLYVDVVHAWARQTGRDDSLIGLLNKTWTI